MKIAVAQINTQVGDFEGNSKLIEQHAVQAAAAGAQMLVCPELALSSYPPEDLLFRPDFTDQCSKALVALAASLHKLAPNLTTVVGHPERDAQGKLRNAASVVRVGKVEATYYKHLLPNYRVFDEERYFEPGNQPLVFECGGTRFGLTICEDSWFAGPTAQAKAAGAQAIITINASPYHLAKVSERHDVIRARCAESGLPTLYAHWSGAQDELIFDGASFALDGRGQLSFQAPQFENGCYVLDFDGASFNGDVARLPHGCEEVYNALKLALADYVNKNRFPGVLLGLSGGIDSALVLALACDALGKERVHAVMMPSDYTASISVEDSRAMAKNFGMKYSEIAIRPMFEQFKSSLAQQFEGRAEDTTEENLQSRIRGMLLMAMSNKFGSMVVTTGNKSEMATGYATLYGDMAGGYAIIKDVPKTLVFELTKWRNTVSPDIPERVITRPPSAELKPGQVDQDSLPPYPILDEIMRRYMEEDQSPKQILAECVHMGMTLAHVERVVKLLQINEYKRRQAPVGAKITKRAFGKDWRYPITSRYKPQW
jgi:NAD+ synthase (glutamine-hydrolysing)